MKSLLEPEIKQAISDVWVDMYKPLTSQIHCEDGLWHVCTGLHGHLFNGIRKTETQEISEDAIQEVIERYKKLKLPFCWIFENEPITASLFKRLIQLHFQYMGEYPGMWLDLKKLIPPTLPPQMTFTVVRTEEELFEWAKLTAIGFNFSQDTVSPYVSMHLEHLQKTDTSYYHLLGMLDGKAVATGSLLVQGKTAGLYNITTHPIAQRKGAASSLMYALCLEAIKRGCEYAVLSATPMGTKVYERLGFISDRTFSVFVKEN